jgi:DNA-binding NarL/FixJ family response regulator
MAEGRTKRGIADELFLSERAVERHVTAIFTKLGPGRRDRATTGARSRC